ncbi:MAG: hypothetical protein JSW41_03905 [Candidatus Aenigmatarchaeota archaeon]|nr:MAG: hypothetical protein JSW41_03905 [Candidatus Aenigmarchaeota archaeon]
MNLQIALAEQIVEMHGSFGLLLMEFREEFGQFLQFKTEKGFAYMRSIVNPEFSRCAENIVLWDSRELEKLLDLLQSDKKKKFWHTMTTTDFSYMLNRMSLSLEAMRRVLTGMVGDIKTAKDVKPSQKIRTLHGSFKDKFLPLVNSVILHCREIFRLTEKEGVFPKAELPDLPNRS